MFYCENDFNTRGYNILKFINENIERIIFREIEIAILQEKLLSHAKKAVKEVIEFVNSGFRFDLNKVVECYGVNSFLLNQSQC